MVGTRASVYRGIEVPLDSVVEDDPRCTVFNTCGRKLYHYTSIETLSLILKHKTIRFNRLDFVNDPRECLSNQHGSAQTLVFVSCWTDSSVETIPHWKIYSGDAGVRIGLPTLMFSGCNNNHKITSDDRLYEISLGVDDWYQIDRDRGSTHSGTVWGPTRIRYVESELDLYEDTVFPEDSRVVYDLRRLGTKKHVSWSFESEVRFRILASIGYGDETLGEFISPNALRERPVSTKYADIKMDPRVFQSMEVMMSPGSTEAHRIVVEALCEKYAPRAKIRQSELIIR